MVHAHVVCLLDCSSPSYAWVWSSIGIDLLTLLSLSSYYCLFPTNIGMTPSHPPKLLLYLPAPPTQPSCYGNYQPLPPTQVVAVLTSTSHPPRLLQLYLPAPTKLPLYLTAPITQPSCSCTYHPLPPNQVAAVITSPSHPSCCCTYQPLPPTQVAAVLTSLSHPTKLLL